MSAIADRETSAAASVEGVGSVRGALAGLSLSTLLSSLGVSIANVGLPSFAATFGASFGEVQWVVLAYLLAVTASIVGVGRLGDVVGRRRSLLGGVVLFTAASIACSLAPTITLLIVARAAQGLGAAAMATLAMALVGETVPKERTGSAMGLLGTMSAVGTALGPSLGGVLIAGLGWWALFLACVPIGCLTFFLVLRFLPADRREAKTKRVDIDAAGTILLASSLIAYTLAMTSWRGGFDPLGMGLLLAATTGTGLFLLVEARAAAPLISPKMLGDPRLSAGLVMNALVSTVVMATLVVGPFHLGRGLGLAATVVGLVMSVGPLVSALTGVPAGRTVDRVGALPTTLAGLAAMAAGCLGLSMTPACLGVTGYAVPLAVLTAGYALFQAANNTAVMSGVRPDRRGVVSGMLNLSRNLGLVTGASAMGAVFAMGAATTDMAAADPRAVAAGMRLTFAVAAALVVIAFGIAVGGRALAQRRPLSRDFS